MKTFLEKVIVEKKSNAYRRGTGTDWPLMSRSLLGKHMLMLLYNNILRILRVSKVFKNGRNFSPKIQIFGLRDVKSKKFLSKSSRNS